MFLIWYEHDLSVCDAPQVLAVRTLAVPSRGLEQLFARDPPVLVGDLLHDRDRQTLRQFSYQKSV